MAAAWVFGPAARGELRPDSDVDVLARLPRPLGLAFSDLAGDTGTPVKCDRLQGVLKP